jgi:hypothetical protein
MLAFQSGDLLHLVKIVGDGVKQLILVNPATEEIKGMALVLNSNPPAEQVSLSNHLS